MTTNVTELPPDELGEPPVIDFASYGSGQGTSAAPGPGSAEPGAGSEEPSSTSFAPPMDEPSGVSLAPPYKLESDLPDEAAVSIAP